MREQVRIENPTLGGNAVTSPARARRFVRSGRAEFVNPGLIRFLDSAGQQKIRLQAEYALQGRLTGSSYDGLKRQLTAAEMKAIPIVNPARMIRGEKSARNWSYETAVRRDGTAADVNHGDRRGA